MIPWISRNRQHLSALLASVLIFFLAYASPVSYAGLDAHLALLVSQSIVENNTSHLDAYLDSSTIDIDHWVAQAPNGHYYYFWPIGSSALSVPYVWVLNGAGYDMAIVDSNHHAQNLLSAALCAVVFLVIYRIGRCYLDPWPSLAISIVSALGSALVSSMGTALWNIDFPILFASLSLLMICRFEIGERRRLDPYALGAFLFGAFFCRPTAATFIVVILAYLLIRSRGAFVKAAISAGTLLALFAFWSWTELGTFLPEYYTTGCFGTSPLPAWLAAVAHLFSPSRGLLIFSPFFALALVVAAVLFPRLKKEALFWVAVSWLVLHLIVASNAAMWWGGHSFGPRLTAEVIPALILLTFFAWRELSSTSTLGVQRGITAGYLSLGLIAIGINAGQGLHNQNTLAWNGGVMAPDIDRHPEYLFDWRFPQFLATNRSLCERNLVHLCAMMWPIWLLIAWTTRLRTPVGWIESRRRPTSPSRPGSRGHASRMSNRFRWRPEILHSICPSPWHQAPPTLCSYPSLPTTWTVDSMPCSSVGPGKRRGFAGPAAGRRASSSGCSPLPPVAFLRWSFSRDPSAHRRLACWSTALPSAPSRWIRVRRSIPYSSAVHIWSNPAPTSSTFECPMLSCLRIPEIHGCWACSSSPCVSALYPIYEHGKDKTTGGCHAFQTS